MKRLVLSRLKKRRQVSVSAKNLSKSSRQQLGHESVYILSEEAVTKLRIYLQMLAFQKKHLRRQLITRSPLFFAPVAVNAAALVTFTMVLRNLAIPPTPFSDEVFFLSEAALAQTDPFCILPAAIGTMAMLNTEIRRALLPAPADDAADIGRFARAVDSLARGFSVLIVSFAMTNPIVC